MSDEELRHPLYRWGWGWGWVFAAGPAMALLATYPSLGDGIARAVGWVVGVAWALPAVRWVVAVLAVLAAVVVGVRVWMGRPR